jgi:hypothetical protein
VGTLPVKLMRPSPGWAASAVPASTPPVTTLMTPGGKPAAVTRCDSSSVVAEACSDGLTTTVLPAASAGASLLASSCKGEFHAVMRAATPTGSRSV